MAKGDDLYLIPGTKRVKYLTENNESSKIVLSKEEVKELDDMFPLGSFKGDRYPGIFMGMCSMDIP